MAAPINPCDLQGGNATPRIWQRPLAAVRWCFWLHPNNELYDSSWTDWALPETQLIETAWLRFKHQGGSHIVNFEYDTWAGEIDFNLMMQFNDLTFEAGPIRRVLVDTR